MHGFLIICLSRELLGDPSWELWVKGSGHGKSSSPIFNPFGIRMHPGRCNQASFILPARFHKGGSEWRRFHSLTRQEKGCPPLWLQNIAHHTSTRSVFLLPIILSS